MNAPIVPYRVEPSALRRSIDPASLGFATTSELAGPSPPVGQERAAAALAFGVGIRQQGYNIFVLGEPGSGRRRLIGRILGESAGRAEHLRDWCYVNRFSDPQQPALLCLPAGRADALRGELARWCADLQAAIPAAFESEEYRARLARIDAEVTEKHAHAMEEIGNRALGEGVALLRTPAGFSVAPLAGKEVMSPEEYAKLPPERQREIAGLMAKYEGELEQTVHGLMQARRERIERVRQLNREVTELAVGQLSSDLQARYRDLPEVLEHLAAAQADVIEHLELFRPHEGEDASRADALARRYAVNVLVNNAAHAERAPIVFEDNPSYTNLVGRIEHLAQFGALITDFTLIRAGALHRANGGYLVIDALKLLTQPFSWDALKRALRSREVRIESLGQAYALVSTQTLEPQPVPLDLKVVLYGPPTLYHLLSAADPEFAALFRVQAELAAETDRSVEANRAMASLVAGMVREHRLRPFDRGAVAAVLEHAARLAEDAEKLSLDVQGIEEVVHEAEFRAATHSRETVSAADVVAAIAAGRERAAYLEERYREAVVREVLLISTSGAAVGQVNGLAVVELGRARFGRVQRITATARIGTGDVVDISREVQLGGAIHSKGVLTLAAFLAARFAKTRPLSITATLSFEQSYGMVEGDSASVAELVALVSSLADAPVRQSLAITGAVNQHGEVQAIGGVNEKIEGFFDLCAARGLDGEHGVVIPAANRAHLMLRADVVEAAAAGRFHVYAVAHVDQAIDLLIGEPAGAEDALGRFPAATVNGRVAERLRRFLELAVERDTPLPPKRRGGRRH